MKASTVLSEISMNEAEWLAEFARDVAERDHMDLVASLEEANDRVARLTAEKADSEAALAEKEAENKRLRAQLEELQNKRQ